MGSENGLGMELHALNGQFLVLDRHDFMIVKGLSRYRKLLGQTSPIGHQAMVAGCAERVRDSLKDAFRVVSDGAGLTVAELCG